MNAATKTHTHNYEKHPKPKGTCPQCNKKKCFRYFVGVDRDYGICDHAASCGYKNIPKKDVAPIMSERTRPEKEPTICYPNLKFIETLLKNQTSNFHVFCKEKLNIPLEHLNNWGVGSENEFTSFVYQNTQKKAINVINVEYNEKAKRNKDKVPLFLSAKKGSKYSICLFGEHLLTDKIVCLVESQKSAIIASYFYPQFDWLATGGANSLTNEKVSVLYPKTIYYLCDSDKAGRDNSTIKRLNENKITFQVVDLFPERNDSSDIADYIIEGLRPDIARAAIEQTSSEGEKSRAHVEHAKKAELFYKPKYETDQDGEKIVKDIIINYSAWIGLLYSFGFRRYDIGQEYVFVKLDKRIITQVTITHIQDYFIAYLKSLPEDLGKGIKRKHIIDKFYKNPANYFCTNKLTLLKPEEEIIINADTKTECFVYYRNGFVKVTESGWELLDYDQLKGYIWKDQIIDREFIKGYFDGCNVSTDSYFAKFMFNISGKVEKRFASICSIVGYNLHTYFETTLKATILTDSAISEDAEGRTGKTLFAGGLGHLKRYKEIPGKDFKFDDKYKYSSCNLDTQIVHINDAKKYIDFENFFNDITEGITVDKKNQQPFKIMVKMIISTNKTIKIEGGSARDRCIEFELANHYNDKYKPEKEFNHWFFRDWDTNEWNLFDNFMMSCVWLYLKAGIIAPGQINLNKRKLLDHTGQEFVEFMEQEKIEFDVKIDRKALHDKFLEAYPDNKADKFKSKLKTFTSWLVMYAKYTAGFKEVDKTNDLIRSNNTNWIIFRHE